MDSSDNLPPNSPLSKTVAKPKFSNSIDIKILTPSFLAKLATIFIAMPLILSPSSVVKAQTTTNQTSNGSLKSFSINAQSSYAVNTNATATPGVTALAEGNLVLSNNSSLSTGVSCGSSSCNGTYNRSGLDSIGNGSSDLLVKGANSAQNLYIDPSSVFKTSVDTSTATQTSIQNSGTASSGISANTTLTVTEQTSTFVNTYINTIQ